ncbi:AAA family ATPase [Clostridium guangxiense]|uniref:AAA family ATPase n=1 Tax=Clostridium guangxiense TaxID=1662055 RepID=UPI001E4A4931|nr:AAA family ATPase [Clostridium guangxiense]MCD2346174.1 AAA family ATPase [Clostridium guangxiense]
MYIKKLEIVNFGPFKRLSFDFKSQMINIIEGYNASGKTHVLTALHFCFIIIMQFILIKK